MKFKVLGTTKRVPQKQVSESYHKTRESANTQESLLKQLFGNEIVVDILDNVEPKPTKRTRRDNNETE